MLGALMEIEGFIKDKKLIEDWMASEKEEMESQDGFIDFWFNGTGIGIVITGKYSGEFHVQYDGNVSMHVTDANDNSVIAQKSNTNDSSVLKNMFAKFKAAAIA